MKGEAEREALKRIGEWIGWREALAAGHEWRGSTAALRFEDIKALVAATLERHQGASGGVRTRVETFKGLPPLVVHELALKPHDVGEACSYCDASAPASGAAPDGDGRETWP